MNKQLIITALLMLALGVGVGYWVASQPTKEQTPIALSDDKKNYSILFTITEIIMINLCGLAVSRCETGVE